MGPYGRAVTPVSPAARAVKSVRQVLALTALAALAGCVVAPYPYETPVTVSTPPSFDRSWDAALGAAADAGVQVLSADRASGRITGSKGGASVTIELTQRSDNSLKVSFDAPDSKETNPTLADRWLAAYQRRMGR